MLKISVIDSATEMDEEIRIKIPIPRIPEFEDLHPNVEELAMNHELVMNYEQLCVDWEEKIQQILKYELPLKPSEFTPLGELDFWRERCTTLKAIHDHIHSREVRLVCQVLSNSRSDVLPGFNFQLEELTRYLEEARDVSRFLSTIERHLKILAHSKSYAEMIEAVQHIMEGLRLIWTLSRHYNKDERMCNFLEMMAVHLYDRTTASLDPSTLFKLEPIAAMEVSDSCQTLLQTWKDAYMSTREKIEQSRKGLRWEFDRSKLFPKNDYVILVAQHLSEMAILLMEFQNFFGPELKAVIGDPKKIEDALKKTFLLVKPFTELKFDPFVVSNQKLWEGLLEQLKKDVTELETEAKGFIDGIFVTKSADSAFEMLMKFKYIETREGVHATLMKKFDETLMIYVNEVHNVRRFYEINKDNPPIGRFHPPVAGRIWWVRGLFYCIKRSIVNFRTQKDVVNTEIGQQACSIYLELAREMKAYEDWWYQHWSEVSSQTISSSLAANVFIKQPADNELGPDAQKNADKMVIKVHLPPEILEMVQETIHLEQMGYRVSEKIRNVALVREHLIRNSRMLNLILDNYYAVRRKLRSHEAEFMERCIRDLEKNFDQGLAHLKWTALGIPDYGHSLTAVIQKFDGVVTQINSVARDIRTRVLEMRTIRLFHEPPYKKGRITLPVLDCWDYFKYWEACRQSTWERLVLLYRGLAPLFVKLESLTYGKTTGKNKRFRSYYVHWEKCIFKYLAKVVIRSLNDFELRMRVEDPLFDIDAVLSAPEIRISPSAHEVYQLVAQGARDCVEGTQKFVRWRRGSCIQVTPIKQAEGGSFVYSFYTDIGRLPRILQLLLQIQENLQTILRNLWTYLKKYREFKNLWLYNKEKTIETFASKNPSIQAYNDKMSFYTGISQRVMDIPQYRVEGFVRLNVRPLQNAISRHAREWVLMLGDYLRQNTTELSKDFDRRVKEFETELRSKPRSIDELKKLYAATKSVEPERLDMEVKYRNLLERYSVMRTYKLNVSEEEVQFVETVWKKWQTLSLRDIKSIKKKVRTMKLRYKL